MNEVIEIISYEVRDEAIRKRIYAGLILAFEDQDCDTLGECKGIDPIYDEVYGEANLPDDDEETPG